MFIFLTVACVHAHASRVNLDHCRLQGKSGQHPVLFHNVEQCAANAEDGFDGWGLLAATIGITILCCYCCTLFVLAHTSAPACVNMYAAAAMHVFTWSSLTLTPAWHTHLRTVFLTKSCKEDSLEKNRPSVIVCHGSLCVA